MSITDPTWDELTTESWFNDEVVSAAMFSCSSRWRSHWGVGPTLIGSKGDENHLRGRHRSRDWTRNSIYCTNRGYGDTDLRDRDAPASFGRYLRAFDIDGMPAGERWAFNRRLDDAVRAGRLPCVAEWFGTFDGFTVVGWYQGHSSASDDTHLDHTHIGIWTTFCEDRAQLDLLCAIILGEDDMTPEQDTMLREVHSLLADGKRLGPAQTAGGGVPIAWIVRQFYEVDNAEAAIADAVDALTAAGTIDPAVLADQIVTRLGPDLAGDLASSLVAVINRAHLEVDPEPPQP